MTPLMTAPQIDQLTRKIRVDSFAKALVMADFNVAKAAKLLEMPYMHLYREARANPAIMQQARAIKANLIASLPVDDSAALLLAA
jgi:hypothetical protein